MRFYQFFYLCEWLDFEGMSTYAAPTVSSVSGTTFLHGFMPHTKFDSRLNNKGYIIVPNLSNTPIHSLLHNLLFDSTQVNILP